MPTSCEDLGVINLSVDDIVAVNHLLDCHYGVYDVGVLHADGAEVGSQLIVLPTLYIPAFHQVNVFKIHDYIL